MDIFYLILISIMSFLLLRELYFLVSSRKRIIKLGKNRLVYILYLIMLIMWLIFLFFNIKGYLNYNNDTSYYKHYIEEILSNVFWIEFLILNLIKSFIVSEIRENGLYIDSNFYKWSKVQSYIWTSYNTIQFKVKPPFRASTKYDFIIKEDLKSKVDETVQKHIHL